MLRKWYTAFTIGVLALTGMVLGACNPSDLSAIGGAVNSGYVTPTLQPGQLDPVNLRAAGFTEAQINKITGAVNTATTAAKVAGSLLCPVLPIAETFANITLAQAASSVAGQTVQSTVRLACRALASAPTYSALGSGQMVSTTVRIGRFDVPVVGVRR
jgi:hypothetical protein